MEGVDYDHLVGRWIKDVPYVLSYDNSKEGWRSLKREYLIPSYMSSSPATAYREFAGLVDKLKRECSVISRIFDAVVAMGKGDLENIRVNGSPAYFPARFSNNINVIYDYLGIKPPSPQKMGEFWEHLSQEIKPEPRLMVPSPAPKYREEKKRTVLKAGSERALYLTFWYLENVNRYPGVCMPISRPSSRAIRDIRILYQVPDIIIYVEKEDFSEIDYRGVVDKTNLLNLCMQIDDIKCIFLSVSWNYSFKKDAHANLFIINKKIQENGSRDVYIFDPWGKTEYEKTLSVMPIVMNQLGIGEANGYKWNFIPSLEWCPVYSFQNLEREVEERIGDYGGFCATWTFWVVDTLLRNPDFKYETVIRKALQSLSEKSPDFNNFIRDYAKTIEKFGQKIQKTMGINIHTETGKVVNLDLKSLEKLERYVGDIYLDYFDSLRSRRLIQNLKGTDKTNLSGLKYTKTDVEKRVSGETQKVAIRITGKFSPQNKKDLKKSTDHLSSLIKEQKWLKKPVSLKMVMTKGTWDVFFFQTKGLQKL